MSDKDFKIKNKLVVNGLTGGAGPLISDSNKAIDSTPYITATYGGTGTTTSPTKGLSLPPSLPTNMEVLVVTVSMAS